MDMDNSKLQDSHPKSVGLVWVMATIWWWAWIFKAFV